MRDKKARLMTFAVAALASCLAAFVPLPAPVSGQDRASEEITRLVVSEDTSPLEVIAPVARDGHRGQSVLRKPPGAGPFPAVVWIHGGLVTVPLDQLKDMALNNAQSSRFLAAGYLVAVITYRSRDHDPQSTVSLDDSLAVVDYLRRLPYVDPGSIVIYGCSGGGDLGLEIAATSTDVSAIVAEEPASIMFTGIFNTKFPKAGERYTPRDTAPISENPKRYFTPEYQRLTREKVGRIRSPILILQGDQHWINRFNADVLIPELRRASKTLEVKTYAGERHCFAMLGRETPAALKAFQDVDAFYRQYLKTTPKALDPSLVKHVPVPPA